MIGRTVSHYRIVEKLGEGGMGVVYKAHDTHLDRFAAIKVLPPEKVADPERKRRFIQEARAASALNHPNIVTIYDIDQQDGVDFLAMEYIQGKTLEQLIGRKGLKVTEALKYGVQITDALSRAHAAGIVHRDLKPGNVMVDEHGLVKVLDFGLAKLTEPAAPDEDELTRTLKPTTEEGAIVGTVAYMSPEQAEAKRLDGRSDIFSFGAVLYEMIAGRRAFQRDSKTSTLAAILTQEPGALSADIPHDLEKVLKRCLRKDPQHRFQTMADLKVALEELKEESESGQLTAAQTPAVSRKWSVPWRGAGVIGAALIVLAAGVFVWQRLHTKPLTDKDILVLADFTNTTGDAVFDVTLREALAVQLEQSPFLKVLGDEHVRQDLRLMGRSARERITNQVAREICQREGEKAMIGGSIAGLGKTYAIALQATNCQSGDTLAREQTEAADKDHVLRAVATAAKGMRAKLGESLASIEKLDVPNQQVTTTSLDAFQAYALGRAQQSTGMTLAAIPFYQRATELDPNFASAHNSLGVMYGNAGETARGMECRKKAFALVDRVSERERLTITAGYYLAVTGELNKAADAYQLLTHTYPREPTFRINLGVVYGNIGESEKALQEYQEAERLDPRQAYCYSNQVSEYLDLDRFDEAKAVAERAVAQKLDSPMMHWFLLRGAYIQGDATEAEKHIRWLSGRPEEYLAMEAQVTNGMALGEFRKAEELCQRGSELARSRNLPGVAARFQMFGAAGEALVGNCEAARSNARAAILPEQSAEEAGGTALPLALCGDTITAQKVGDETSKRYPLHTLWNAVYLPSLQATIELSRNQPEKAVEVLRPAVPYERAYPYVSYTRGLAYLQFRKGTEAAAEFQKILDHKGATWGPYYPLAYAGLARAAALAGDGARARRAYQDFLALWKDADPDLAILREVRQEYAKLK